MDGRLLMLAALLASNALYLIWRAKGSPQLRLDLRSLKGRLDRTILVFAGIFRPEKDLKQATADSQRAHMLLQPDPDEFAETKPTGPEPQSRTLASNPQDGPKDMRLSEQISSTTRSQISKGLSAYLLSIPSDSEGSSLIQAIQVDLTDLPQSRSTAPGPSDLDRAELELGQTARLVLDLSEIEVDLTIRPPDQDENEAGGVISIKEWLQGSEIFSEVTAMNQEVPAALLPVLGLVDSVSESQKQNENYLARLLAVLKPSRVRLLETPPILSLAGGETNDIQSFCDPLVPLVYTGRMPLAVAGNTYFTQPSQILNYLEIGPWIPVSDRCETGYGFVFSRWRIRVLAIRCKWPEKKGMLKRSSKSPLPGILWDRTMGFSAMMAGTNGSDDLNTRIVLIVEKVKHAVKFAEEIDKLAKKEMDTEDMAMAKDAKSRLKSFKKMMYFVCPEAGQEVQRIFLGSKDKRQGEKPKGKRDREKRDVPRDERHIDLPPLEPEPLLAQQAVDRG